MAHGSDPMRDNESEDAALRHALQVLAASREGVLLFNDQHVPVKFVTDPATGHPIMSVPAAVLLATDHTLMVPEDSDDALQLMITPDAVEESIITDRWMAYHGTPDHVRWADAWVESAKHGPWVFDGEAMMRRNPLAGAEPGICKKLNADKAALAKLCQRFAGVPVPVPTCVGADPDGLYIRAAFGVVRVPFEQPAEDAAAVDETVAAMLKSC
jgi:hypothetical protein